MVFGIRQLWLSRFGCCAVIAAIAISACGADEEGCTVKDGPSVRLYLVSAHVTYFNICDLPLSTTVNVLAQKDNITYPLKPQPDPNQECVYVLNAGTGDFRITAQAYRFRSAVTSVTVKESRRNGMICGPATKPSRLK